jgi:hypothetical protein
LHEASDTVHEGEPVEASEHFYSNQPDKPLKLSDQTRADYPYSNAVDYLFGVEESLSIKKNLTLKQNGKRTHLQTKKGELIMPEGKEIRLQVIDAFSLKTKQSAVKINALVESGKDHLFNDLGMSDQAIDSMGSQLTKISKKYNGGLSVPISAVRQCETVSACIELTTRRSNGKE